MSAESTNGRRAGLLGSSASRNGNKSAQGVPTNRTPMDVHLSSRGLATNKQTKSAATAFAPPRGPHRA